MYPTFFVLALLLLAGSSPSQSATTTGGTTTGGPSTPTPTPTPVSTTCTPYVCNINPPYTESPKNITGNKAFNIGVILTTSTVRTDPYAVSFANYAAYVLNNDPTILTDVSVNIYSRTASSQINTEATAIALFDISHVQALIVDITDDSFISIAQLAAAYGAPIISLTSTTEAFKSKTNYPTIQRISSPNQVQVAASLQVLLSLDKTNIIFIFATDSYGIAAATDMQTQSLALNMSVKFISIPSTGNITPSMAAIKYVIGEDWNTFVVAVSTAQAVSVLSYMNTSGYINEQYLYIMYPNVEKLVSFSTLYVPVFDGAITIFPMQQDPDSPEYGPFKESWLQTNNITFPGAGTLPFAGYLAYDAVMTLANGLQSLMADTHNTYPQFPSTTYLTYLKNVNFSGLSGNVAFDSSGDRIGSYVILNHQGNQTVQVGTFSNITNKLVLDKPFVFYNGSLDIPILHNVNYSLFCSYTPPTPTAAPGTLIDGAESEDNSTSDEGTTQTPIITGHIDPHNTSRCICDPGYGGDRCNVIVAIKEYRKLIPGISIALGVVIGLAMLVALFATVMLSTYWESFRKHGPFFCAIIIIGVYFAYASVIVLLPVPTEGLCMAFPWLLGIGFTLVYGCLFIKTWTLYKIYRSAEKMQKTTLTPLYIVKGIGLYLCIELIILIVWTTVDRPAVHYEKMVDGNYLLQCTAHPTFWAIFAGTKAVWLIFGALLSVLTRHVAQEYSESKSIAYATYNIIALLVIGIPLAIALQNIPGGLMIVEVGVILIAFTFTMCSLFFGIWMQILMPTSAVFSSNSKGQTSPTTGTRTGSSSFSPNTSNGKTGSGKSGSGKSGSAKSSDSPSAISVVAV